MSQNNLNNNLPWIEKYRPKKLDDVISQSESINILNNTKKTGELPHLLLYGGPGTGKTSSIIALCKELFGTKVNERILELNASDERGINIIRTKIIPFAKTAIGHKDKKTLCPDYKIIILDEADAMTKEAQAALRKVMEDTTAITRFCFICNYIDKIIEPIQSRCVKIRFKPIDNNLIKKKLQEIAKSENINIDDSGLDAIVEIIDGDLRNGIVLLQNVKYIKSVIITNKEIYENTRYISQELYDYYISLLDQYAILDITNVIKSKGYKVKSILKRTVHKISKMKLNSSMKNKLMFEFADIDTKIYNGADEDIQLIRIFIAIKSCY